MQRLEVSGAVRPIYGSLGAKGLMNVILISSYETGEIFVMLLFCLKSNAFN
jgi:hypothetical protein